MCAALLTSHVKFNDNVYRITTCEKNDQNQPSPQQYIGITTGKMKQSNTFIGMKYLLTLTIGPNELVTRHKT